MIITITGLPGSGKTSVARELAKHLHIKHYSMGEIFRKIAHKEHISLINLMKKERLLNSLDKKQKIIAKEYKNCIIDSRLGAYLIKNAHIKIYIHAPLDIRVKRIAKRDKINYKKALHETSSREYEELQHYKKHYKIDYRNKKLYNIIINTENLTVKQTVKKILKKINSS